MNWKPISEYDKLKIKPELCVFYFSAKPGRSIGLTAMLHGERHYGHRICTHYIELPPVPVPVEEKQ